MTLYGPSLMSMIGQKKYTQVAMHLQARIICLFCTFSFKIPILTNNKYVKKMREKYINYYVSHYRYMYYSEQSSPAIF